jgi:hypothetical protein
MLHPFETSKETKNKDEVKKIVQTGNQALHLKKRNLNFYFGSSESNWALVKLLRTRCRLGII